MFIMYPCQIFLNNIHPQNNLIFAVLLVLQMYQTYSFYTFSKIVKGKMETQELQTATELKRVGSQEYNVVAIKTITCVGCICMF